MMNNKTLCQKMIEKELALDKIEMLKVGYALEVLKNESMKFIVLLFLFTLLQSIQPFLFCLFLLLPIRSFSGGLHMKTNWSCFIISFSLFSIAVYAPVWIYINDISYQLLLLSSLCIIFILSPIAPTAKPIISKSKYMKCKYFVAALSLFDYFLLSFAPLEPAMNHIGVWIIVIQAMQLSIAYILKLRERGNS